MPLTTKLRRWAVAFALLWFFFILYPRPTALGQSLYRLLYPPINAEAAKYLAFYFPAAVEAHMVERFVLETVPYRYDWETYNFPWYFPTVEEVLAKGEGDCKSRFIILASLLEALAIPYDFFISPTHIWVSYEGKTETTIENKKAALFYYDEKGQPVLKMPGVNWKDSFNAFWEAFWVYMPLPKKQALLSGLAFAALLFFTPESATKKLFS